MVDLQLWRNAGEAILVNPERDVKENAKRQNHKVTIFDNLEGLPLKRYLKAIRLHQWLKNLLVFVPLLMAHRFGDPVLIGQALLAFLAFGICASSVYLLNDLLDLPDVRKHPTKCNRQFASGSISIVNGALLIPVLLIGAFALALLLPT